MTAALSSSDFVRAPLLSAADPVDFKEWQHFVVHAPDVRILVNLSLTHDGRGLIPRVIVVVHHRTWTGAVERFEHTDVTVSADLSELAVGGNRITVRPDGYDIVVDLPTHQISGQIHCTSGSRPFVVNNQPVGDDGRMCWLFVPRLRADGRLRIAGREHRIADAVAYHDHNWGRFRWGDDFGWTWGTILPTTADDPWSLVFLQMTDRRRLRTLSQALYVWHRDEPAAIFRHAAVQTHIDGPLGRPADCTLPAPMRLVLNGRTPGVPERIRVSAERAGDTVHAEFRAQSYVRLAQPSEAHLDRSVVLCEAGGTAHVRGRVGGRDLDVVGTAVFEFLHG
ncbi:hypothetical protein E4P42_10155 [Mycobacterium sp. PS03-16]|uniref:hypothetical protein n=1 Tax=Mycobacterium sp. PS03-16 TaxID=2559611 RepID=UPI00107417CE|nr:hypothetical protein [Mycobacterium sp. PS03-16]TFV58856.1 hypothetical protein E4P42_10155 [Mycobacterium sp. PS03-16]